MVTLNIKNKLMALAIAGATYAGAAGAAMVDGIVKAGEYSTSGTTVNLGWATDDGSAGGEVQGTFSYVIENNLIYAALSAPTDFTDNVYGAPSTDPDSGWGAGRAFDKLLGSDRLLFGLDTNKDGSNNISVVIDYLAKDRDPGTGTDYEKLDLKGSDKGSDLGAINKPAAYVQGAEDLVQNEYRAVFGESGGSVIQDVATSLEYNLANNCGDIIDSPDIYVGDCSAIFTFEWSMTASEFTSFDTASILSPLMHASPSKVPGRGNSIFEPDCMADNSCESGGGGTPPPGVPEPGNLVLMLTGLIGLAWSRRRKARKIS